ncbi:MAG TPA: chemotaxis-specific protein-glutamate methyltransferase CheB [Gaiellales bacterium]|jgi:two-component system, chemotaxis family, protein-glutamate methylesterase/glutaminase|nr:chemotaxis-specific protein-glutamate methyltransferase CheB [Gaiellales bacterium]
MHTRPTPSPSRIRVVVADDSAFMRHVIADGLRERGADVVAVAADGDEALRECARHSPDVLSLDLAMPGLDGIGVLKELRACGSDVAVVVVSAFSPAHGARAVDALAEGAVELVAKPSGGVLPDVFFAELYDKTHMAAASHRKTAAPPRPAPAAAAPPAPSPAPVRTAAARAMVIACSTGGPRALAELVPALPANLGCGIAIVQHMPAGFTGSLAERLDRASQLTVREARTGDRLTPGVALLAPGGFHMRLSDGGTVRLTEDAEIGGLRPRADLTISDAAAIYGNRLLVAVLTGMGKDGLEGAQVVKRLGGRILVEDESTCTVYGMPRSISEAHLADAELPLGELAAAIAEEAR